MSLRTLPQIQNFALPEGLEGVPSEAALDRWNPGLRCAAAVKNAMATGATVIEIFGEIGKDPWTGEGVSAAEVAMALKGAKDVVVNINSPGGDFFEGTAIFNLLAAHAGKVTINCIGLAASSASIIFMAGDERMMGPASFVMIHNAWSIALGDRHDMTAAAETLGSIDGAIRDLYVAATGKHSNSIVQMMDDETWLNAKDAVAGNFATGTIKSSEIAEDPQAKAMAHPMAARMRADAIFASHGLTRSQRRGLINNLKDGKPSQIQNTPDLGVIAADLRSMRDRVDGKHNAADPATPRAGFAAASSRLLDMLTPT